jgi:tetraacyldisaccharide 4'-kinase
MGMLPDAETFKRLVDGSTPGVGAEAARLALAAVALPYGLAVAARNAAYDRGLLQVSRVPTPVISVGNLTLGGTGKTPLVAWVARRLAAAGRRPAIVSRGYGARPGERSDEAAELGLVVPEAMHVANRDRAAGCRTAIAAGCDAAVLDDGFQHRRLHRDLDIVAIDATDPFGCGRLFPRGLLRESLAGLARADAVVLTRASAINGERRKAIRAALTAGGGQRFQEAWMEAEHRPVTVRLADGGTRPLDSLRGLPIVAFAGIGNPAAFRATLARLAAEVIEFVPFPDHHAYTAADFERLAAQAARHGAAMLVTTLKDLVKVPAGRSHDLPVGAVEIAIEPLSGGEHVAALIDAVASRAGASTAGRRP